MGLKISVNRATILLAAPEENPSPCLLQPPENICSPNLLPPSPKSITPTSVSTGTFPSFDFSCSASLSFYNPVIMLYTPGYPTSRILFPPQEPQLNHTCQVPLPCGKTSLQALGIWRWISFRERALVSLQW